MAIGVGLKASDAPRGVYETFVPEVDFPVWDESYPYVRLIDPYGDTVFTSHQCHVIVSDFERLAAERPGADTQAVLELVRRCAGDRSWSLWFIGD